MSIDSRVSVLIDVYSSSCVSSPSPSPSSCSASISISSSSSSISTSSSSSSGTVPYSGGILKKPRDFTTIAHSTQLPHVPTYEPIPAQSQQAISSSLIFIHASDDSLPSASVSNSLHVTGKKRQRTAEVEELLVQLRMETNADDNTAISRTYWPSSAVMPAHDSPSTARMSQSPTDESSASGNNVSISSLQASMASSTPTQAYDRADNSNFQFHSQSHSSFADVTRSVVALSSTTSSNVFPVISPEPLCPQLVSTFVLDHLSRMHVPSLSSEFPSVGVNNELLSLILLCQFPVAELPSNAAVPDLTFQQLLKQLRCESDSHLHYLFQTHLSSFRPATGFSASAHLSSKSTSSFIDAASSITPAFKQFYLNCFQIIRQISMPQHAKFIPLSIAIHYLSLLLLPRSPSHMYPFRAFLHQRIHSTSSTSEQLRMSKDQWSCCLEWITSIDAHTFDGYEKEGSWPILMDDFVQWIWSQQGQAQQHLNTDNNGSPQTYLQTQSTPRSMSLFASSDADMGSTSASLLTIPEPASTSTSTTNEFSPMLLTRSANRLGLHSPLWRLQSEIASHVLPLDEDQPSSTVDHSNHTAEPPELGRIVPFQLQMVFSSSGSTELVSDTPTDTRMTE